MADQRVEEIRRGRAAPGMGRYIWQETIWPSSAQAGVVEVTNRGQAECRAKAADMFYKIADHAGKGLPCPFECDGIGHVAGRGREGVAAIERGGDEGARGVAIIAGKRLPERGAFESLHAKDSPFAALAPFRHALGSFEAVKVVGVDVAVADADAFRKRRIQRHLDLRQPPCHRQRRAGQECEAEPCESSTISRQCAQVVERCLSLKTGTARPLCSKIFTTRLKNS